MITGEARQWIGRVVVETEVQVSRSDIRKYSYATGIDSGIHVDAEMAIAAGFRDLVAPPGFHHAVMSQAKMLVPASELGPDGVPAGILPPIALSRAMAGGSEIWYKDDIFAGDRVLITEKIEDIYSKTGRKGELVFVVFLAAFSVEGSDVLLERTTRIMW